MLLNILQQEWAQIVLSAVALGIAGLISYIFRLIQIWISTKIKNERIRKAMEEVSDEVETSVMAVYQTYVKELKKTGDFSKAAQGEALEKAMNKAWRNISQTSKDLLKKESINIVELLEDHIESAIAVNKELGYMKFAEDLRPLAKQKTLKG